MQTLFSSRLGTTSKSQLFVACLLVFSLTIHEAFAGGLNGRGGGGRGGGGMSRPSMGGGGMSRPSMGGGGMQRPSMGGGGGMQRPAPSRPGGSSSMGNLSRPAPRPNLGSMPGLGSSGSLNRPSPGLGNLNRPTTLPASRPSTGMKPSTRPAPGERPNLGNSLGGGNSLRPETRPSTRPTTKPDLNRPNTGLPNIPGRPDLAGRPGGVTRPGTTLPGTTLPGTTLPGVVSPNNKLPGVGRPGSGMPSTRPAPGDLGDFLGMGKPLRPTTLPGDLGNVGIGQQPTRPNLPPGIGEGGLGSRPLNPNNKLPPGIDIANRPGNNRPGDNRPGNDRPIDWGNNRPGNDRPIDWGNVNIGNTVINQRPSWVSIDRNQYVNINNRWQNQLGGMHNWATTNPGRLDYWNRWGNDVRHHWHHHGDCQGWFRPSWWNNHPHGWGAWHYGYWYHNRPWNYWWTVPAFSAVSSWFTWTAPATVWAQPVYYDYGQGGNVVYNNDVVYINEQPVAKADEFAQTAAVLASVPPPKDESVLETMEWMALGTFTITTDEKDLAPSRVLQLAVNKQGIISGTMFNSTTDKAHAVQGRVDKETQRVAFRIGDAEDVVCETGLYNLTQSEAPMLVHFGTDKVENYLLVRLDQPEDEQAAEASAEPSLP